MMTVNEVSRLTGVSIRALHYYDQIGLLPATGHTDSGYRLYDDTALEHLQQILLFRELEFSLKDIQRILSNSAFDREKGAGAADRTAEAEATAYRGSHRPCGKDTNHRRNHYGFYRI